MKCLVWKEKKTITNRRVFKIVKNDSYATNNTIIIFSYSDNYNSKTRMLSTLNKEF